MLFSIQIRITQLLEVYPVNCTIGKNVFVRVVYCEWRVCLSVPDTPSSTSNGLSLVLAHNTEGYESGPVAFQLLGLGFDLVGDCASRFIAFLSIVFRQFSQVILHAFSYVFFHLEMFQHEG